MVKLGRTTNGYPSSAATASTSFMEWATSERADSAPASSTTFLNSSRSSPRSMASREAPISSTLYFLSTPASPSDIAAFSAVWPPKVGSRASGRSLAMICSRMGVAIGSM